LRKVAVLRVLAPLALILLGGCSGVGDDAAPVVHLHVADSPPPPSVVQSHSKPVTEALPGVASQGGSNGASPPPWKCPPHQPFAATVSNVSFTGPCAFTHTLSMQCTKTGSTMEVSFVRNLDGGWAMQLKVTISQYTGPGTYKNAFSRFEISQDPSWVTWSVSPATILIASGERSGSLGQTEMHGGNQSGVIQPPESVQGSFSCG
jgi:hypothetical protein